AFLSAAIDLHALVLRAHQDVLLQGSALPVIVPLAATALALRAVGEYLDDHPRLPALGQIARSNAIAFAGYHHICIRVAARRDARRQIGVVYNTWSVAQGGVQQAGGVQGNTCVRLRAAGHRIDIAVDVLVLDLAGTLQLAPFLDCHAPRVWVA